MEMWLLWELVENIMRRRSKVSKDHPQIIWKCSFCGNWLKYSTSLIKDFKRPPTNYIEIWLLLESVENIMRRWSKVSKEHPQIIWKCSSCGNWMKILYVADQRFQWTQYWKMASFAAMTSVTIFRNFESSHCAGAKSPFFQDA